MPNDSALPPELQLFRSAPIPDIANLTHIERVNRLNTYRRIRMEFQTHLTQEEMQHVVRMLADQRVETLKAKRAEASAGKKAASAAPIKAFSLDEL